MPPLHVGVPFAAPEQALPQAPQLFGSLAGLTQLPPQSVGVAPPQAPAHAGPAPVSVQTGVAPEHTVPQLPQLAADESLASQPFIGSPSQSA
jgi:hypothetical protein